MRKYSIKKRDFLNLSISLFAVVTAWVAFSIYHSFTTTTISEDLQMQITPINPTFDTETIESLKSRKKIVPLFQTDGKQEASTPATLTPTPIEEEEESLQTDELVPTDEPVPTEEPTPAI